MKGIMQIRTITVALGTAVLLASTSAWSAPEDKGPLHGPATAQLGDVAKVKIPEGYVFMDGDLVRAFMELQGLPTTGNELGMLAPTNADWSVSFDFDPVGYVKDEDKDKLNADKLLDDYRKGTAEYNKYRKKAGEPPIHVVGWEQPPHYNEESHNLEWAIKGECEGELILNYDTRLLGRKGVMQVKLIVAPDELAETLPTFNDLLAGYSFNAGETYAEYRKGDKIAKYGLAALVTAGAAAGAAKLGLFAWLAVFFKKFAKLIVVAVVAVAAFFKKMIARLFGRGGEAS